MSGVIAGAAGGAAAGVIGSLGGFAPFPLGIMVPFMEMQSGVMARAFGLNYEIGKRTIKSMSNEKFNALTEADIVKMIRSAYVASVDEFVNQIPASTEMQKEIINQLVELEKMKIEMYPRLIAQWPEALYKGFFGVGKDIATGGNEPTNPSGETYEEWQNPNNDPTPTPEPTPPKPVTLKLNFITKSSQWRGDDINVYKGVYLFPGHFAPPAYAKATTMAGWNTWLTYQSGKYQNTNFSYTERLSSTSNRTQTQNWNKMQVEVALAHLRYTITKANLDKNNQSASISANAYHTAVSMATNWNAKTGDNTAI